MFLQINNNIDYNKDILPYIRNGICIDTCIMKIFIDGFIDLRFSKKKNAEYQNLLSLFEYLKISNKWNKFWITPHLLTEIYRHLCQDNDRNKRVDFEDIITEIMPILKEIEEIKNIEKNEILNLIDIENKKMELGDVSIFIATKDMLNTKNKVTILSQDNNIINRYKNNPDVMVINYKQTILDLKYGRK